MLTGRRCYIRDGPTVGAVVLEHLLRDRDLSCELGAQNCKISNQPTIDSKDEDWVFATLTVRQRHRLIKQKETDPSYQNPMPPLGS